MEVNNITVRKAEVEDARSIARIHVKTWQCAYQGQMPQEHLDNLSIDEKTKRWEKIIAEPFLPNKIDLVAMLDNEIVGFCSVGPCRDEDLKGKAGEIWAIYVDPDHMNQGIGSSLIEEAKEYLRGLGFTEATLWVLDTNVETIKWYEHKGWKKEGTEKVEKEDSFNLREVRYITDL